MVGKKKLKLPKNMGGEDTEGIYIHDKISLHSRNYYRIVMVIDINIVES